MKFTLEIELGNAAMQSAGDIARALQSTAVRLGYGTLRPDESGRISDDNGNTVGGWEVR